jgi:hypothetical protein
MRRRDVVLGGLAATVLARAGRTQSSEPQSSADDFQRRMAEERAKALAAFPFERVTTSGRNAVETWERLRDAGRGAPVILGDDDSMAIIAELWSDGFASPATRRSAQEILDAAAALQHPDDLVKLRELEEHRTAEFLKTLQEEHGQLPAPTVVVRQPDGTWKQLTEEEARAAFYAEPREPEVGEWPSAPHVVDGPSVLQEFIPQRPQPDARGPLGESQTADDADGERTILELLQKLPPPDAFVGRWRERDRVDIALIPSDDWTTIPAHFNFGAWNACPPPEYHVSAMRSWRARYGAELVGLAHDTLNLRAARRPASRAEALLLAREQYTYCSDIVDQGTGTLNALAASLMASDWWHFWWD